MKAISTKDLNRLSKQYILDCIYIENEEGQEITGVLDPEKLSHLYSDFKATQQWNIDRRGEYRAFEEWIKGLPSSFNIAFTNYDILQLAKSWGSIPENATERQEDKILDNYWNLITVKTFQLFRKYKIS